ncbi:MAG: hypothetical protein AAB697_03005 [Patescibacteria group bacterium]
MKLLIIITVGLVLFLSRYIFVYRYEPEYYENWYYHSQWNIPQSTRGISDGELYKFVGYRLAQGENPFDLNSEVPPFGKYLFGLAEKYLGNPFPVTMGLYILSILITYYLSGSPLVTLLFASTPFVATQVHETMLDLPLMTAYLIHAWLFVRYLHNRKLRELSLAGLFLGLASGIKLPIYSLPILLLGLFLSKFSPIYLVSTVAGYGLAWFNYFIAHPNPIPWIRLHTKMFGFYSGSLDNIDHLNQWKTIFINSYQGWWQTKTINISDWSLLLPLGVIATVLIFVKSLQRKNLPALYISSLAIIFLAINSLVPFWPRYLMPVIPLFCILIYRLFHNQRWVIWLLVLLNFPGLVSALSPKDYSGDIEASARFISTRAYRELYRSLPVRERARIPEDKFISTYEQFLDHLDTQKITTQIKDKNIAEITYTTKYGPLAHSVPLIFTKINNQWKMNWDWDIIWPGFTPDSKLVIEEKTPSFGKALYIIPRQMYDWTWYLNSLSAVLKEGGIQVEQNIRTVVPDNYPRFVGFFPSGVTPETLNKALEIPGTRIRDDSPAPLPVTIYLLTPANEKIYVLK